MKSTRQRTAIERALGDARAFRSAQELHAELRTRGERVGLATVYRTLQMLADRGEVDALVAGDGETRYRRCGERGHHHHLICRTCGTAVELASDELEAWAEASARRHGFTEVTHVAELYGLCGGCAP